MMTASSGEMEVMYNFSALLLSDVIYMYAWIKSRLQPFVFRQVFWWSKRLLAYLCWKFMWAFWTPVVSHLSVFSHFYLFLLGDTGNSKIVNIHFTTFKIPLLWTTSPFSPNLAQSVHGWREFKFLQTKGHTWPISTIPDKWHPWVKVHVIEDCSNEGPHPFSRGDNIEIKFMNI